MTSRPLGGREQGARRRRGLSHTSPLTNRPDMAVTDEADETLAQMRAAAEFERWLWLANIELREAESAFCHDQWKRTVEQWLDVIRILRRLLFTALLIAAIVLLLRGGPDELGIVQLIGRLS